MPTRRSLFSALPRITCVPAYGSMRQWAIVETINCQALTTESRIAAAIVKKRERMTSRMSRESKAQATHVAAMKIVEAEKLQHRSKTVRLRQLRLANQAEPDKDDLLRKQNYASRGLRLIQEKNPPTKPRHE